jgi:hypothetical protein
MSQTKVVSGRATSIVDTKDGYGVMYHRTLVAEFLWGGKVRLNSGGWTTVTTKRRMNQFANQYCGGRFAVYQRRGEWYVDIRHGRAKGYEPIKTLPFEDGMEFSIDMMTDGREVQLS